jgi:homoserine kinase
MKTKATVLSPATIANIVCGFDVLGLALESPCDEITLTMHKGPLNITIENLDSFQLPTDPTKNVMGVALQALLDTLEESYTCHIASKKIIMPGSGVGSSAASAAGIVYAANAILENRFTAQELIEFAKKGEQLASGSAHADNIAPCIMGGVTLVHCNDPIDVVSLPYPELFIALIHPQIELRTSDARAVIKSQVPLTKAVRQWAHVAALVAGFTLKDTALIARSLHDEIIEPSRKLLIPHFDQVKSLALASGAIGGGISGSGPSIFMFCTDAASAEKVANKMHMVYDSHHMESKKYVSKISATGVHVTSLI